LKIEYLWMSLHSVIFYNLGLLKIDPPEADLKSSIFNRKFSIIIS